LSAIVSFNNNNVLCECFIDEAGSELVEMSGATGEIGTGVKHDDTDTTALPVHTDNAASGPADSENVITQDKSDNNQGQNEKGKSARQNSKRIKATGWRRVFISFLTLYRGWKTYMQYDVAFAGLGLSALYMTVLGFDNITVGKHKAGNSTALDEDWTGV